MLAIVIPYYKKAFFKETLQSLANQTDKRFHVYIGNDGSLEDPTDLITQYENEIPLFYKKFEENLGATSLVKQWERCIALTKNEQWITILGDDDMYDKNVVAEFYNHLEKIAKEKISVVRFATNVINTDSEIISKTYMHPATESSTDFLLRKFKGGTRSSLSEYFFEAEKVKKKIVKDFPLAWSSDTLAVVEFSNNRNIHTINDALVSFRLSDKNITGQGDSIKKNEAWFAFYDYLLSKYGKQYPKKLVNLLFDRIEKVQLNNKKTPFRWMKLFRLYIIFSQYSRFLSLFVKIKKSIQ